MDQLLHWEKSHAILLETWKLRGIREVPTFGGSGLVMVSSTCRVKLWNGWGGWSKWLFCGELIMMTVDGRHSVPVDMQFNTFFTRFYTSQVVQDSSINSKHDTLSEISTLIGKGIWVYHGHFTIRGQPSTIHLQYLEWWVWRGGHLVPQHIDHHGQETLFLHRRHWYDERFQEHLLCWCCTLLGTSRTKAP